jgi:Protein of unknown function (DUF2939)
MRRALLALLCLLLAFYVGWPLWSVLQLRNALKAEDEATVARKIDFPSVRESMRPAVTQKAAETFDATLKQLGGAAGLFGPQLKAQILPKLVDSALDNLISPPNVIRIANDAGPMKERVERVLREQMGKLPGVPGGGGSAATGGTPIPGGLGQIAGQLGLDTGKMLGKAQPPQPAASPVRTVEAGSAREFGFANIKRFAFTSPLGFEVGLAKDAASTTADITAQMGFSGLDWRLTGLIPRL